MRSFDYIVLLILVAFFVWLLMLTSRTSNYATTTLFMSPSPSISSTGTGTEEIPPVGGEMVSPSPVASPITSSSRPTSSSSTTLRSSNPSPLASPSSSSNSFGY